MFSCVCYIRPTNFKPKYAGTSTFLYLIVSSVGSFWHVIFIYVKNRIGIFFITWRRINFCSLFSYSYIIILNSQIISFRQCLLSETMNVFKTPNRVIIYTIISSHILIKYMNYLIMPCFPWASFTSFTIHLYVTYSHFTIFLLHPL